MNSRILQVCLLFVALLGFSVVTPAQSPSAYPYAKPVPNDSTTGTTQFTLTKINSSGNAVIMTTSDTNGYSGVCVSNCGKTGTAWIAFAGLVPLTVDGTATADHYITISSTTGGDGHDTGATTYPTSGAVIGRIQAGATSGNQAMIDIFPAEIISASGSSVALGGTNTYTANTTASSSDNDKLVIMNCSSACAYTLPATQPSTTFFTQVESVGSTLATIALAGGDTFNGSASVPVLNSYRIFTVYANTQTSTDYKGDAPLVAGTNVTLTPAPNGLSVASSGGSGLPYLNTGIIRTILPERSGGSNGLGDGITTYTTGGGTIADGPATATNTVFNDFNTSTAFTSACATGCVGFSTNFLYAAGVSGTIYQFQFDWPTNISTNTGRYWAGLCTSCGVSTLGATDTPTGEAGVYLRWSTIAGDTNPVCITSNGSATHTYTPSPTITPNQVNKGEFDDNGTSWTLKINGTAVCSGMSTDIPSSGTNLAFFTSATPNTANVIHDYFYGYQESPQ